NQLILGEAGLAANLLAEAEGLLAQNFDSARAEELWTYALMARVALHRGDSELAHTLATAAARLIGRLPQAAIYALAGYSGVAEVLLSLWESQTRHATGPVAAEARRVVAAFGRFALV